LDNDDARVPEAQGPETSVGNMAAKAENAAIVREVLSGRKSPRRDVVLLNAAAALVAAGRADHLADGIPLAAQSIDSGAAAAKLEALASFTTQ